MFILDTDVVSELRKPHGQVARAVFDWVTDRHPTHLHLSAISVLELETGLLLAERRDPAKGAVLRTWLHEHVLQAFARRILPVDAAIARTAARLHVPDRKPDRDALIAATALVHGMSVVTRNTADFLPTGVPVFNPWP